jgi:hypothetical protein
MMRRQGTGCRWRVARTFFQLEEGLQNITAYNKDTEQVTMAKLERVEYYSDMIEGKFIAVFKPKTPSAFTNEVAFCVGEGKNILTPVDFNIKYFETDSLTRLLTQRMNQNSADVMMAFHTRVVPPKNSRPSELLKILSP